MEFSRKAILCLCHDDMTLRVRRLLLEHFGYKVLAANSLQETTKLLHDSCPDMLLMDNTYPGHDYEDTAETAKSICPELLAVVLMPGYALRSGENGSIDRFLPIDGPREEWLAELQSLFSEQDRQYRIRCSAN
jgi:CheY-like chemotaxis protein